MPRLWCIGCGDIGTAVGARMQAQGWDVTGFRRRPQEAAPFAQVALDVGAAPDALAVRLADYSPPDHVLYTVTPAARTEAGYRLAYDWGVAHVLAVIPEAHWWLVSSTGVYHQHAGEWVDEDSPVVPVGFSGQSLLAGERHVVAHAAAHTVVRLSGIYGAERPRNLRRLEAGEPIVRHPPQYTNRIHREDAVGFLAYLMARASAGQTVDPLYLCTDDDPAAEWDVMCWLAQGMGLPLPPEALPQGGQNKRCSNARMKASGYVLQYPSFREGYAAAFEAWRRDSRLHQ